MIRRTLVALLALGLTCAARAADPAGANGAAQDAAAKDNNAGAGASRWQRHVAWQKRTVLDAYDTAGHRDPKWDGPAREALAAFYQKNIEGIGRTGDEEDLMWARGGQALNAGCHDGLLQYAMGRNLNLRTNDPNPLSQARQGSAEAIRDSKYPAYRKVLSFLRAAQFTAEAGDAAKARGYADAALALMPEVFAEPGLPEAELYDVFSILSQAKAAYGDDLGAMGEKAMAALEKSPQPRSFVLTGKGMYYVVFAWDARGGGFAGTVTDKGWQGFRERIAVARDSLEQAWKLDPNNADAAAEMITVEMADSKGGRSGMEQWYSRAMKADPSCRAAATRKMTYLEPKWHGKPEAMLKFGRELLAGGNWDAGLPMLLVDAHWTLGSYANLGIAAYPTPDYFKENA